MILTNIWSNPFDNAIAEAFSSFYTKLPEGIQEFVQAFSALGNKGLFLILIGLLFLIPKKTRKIGFICLLSVAFTALINDLILKGPIARARPYMDPDLVPHLPSLITLADGTIVPPGLLPGNKSFPSGHTFQCFAAIGGMTFLYAFDKEDRKFNLWFLIFFILYGSFMGLTRVILSHHYATDVIAGALIGFASGIGIYYIVKYFPVLFNKLFKKESKENEEN